jgi:hypothetical protein
MIDMIIVVYQLNMAVIKPDPDSDWESCPTSSHNENELLDMKEVEDNPFIKCPVVKFEPEVSRMYIHYYSLQHCGGWLVSVVSCTALCCIHVSNVATSYKNLICLSYVNYQ